MIEVIQDIIRQSIDFNKFSDVTYGEVVGVEPLKIKLNEILTLEEENIILTNAVKDHEIDITVQWETEDKNIQGVDTHTHPFIDTGALGITKSAETLPSTNINSTHKHDIKGKKKIIVHNKLKSGEKVLMIKTYGGQKYVVIDRITEFKPEGQWI